MTTQSSDTVNEVRTRLIEAGGRTTQDLGMGRTVGQVLAYVYLSEGECSLDMIGADLGLSKASVSIAARQLDSLGVLKQVWKKGDRKNYYRTVDHFGSALRRGLIDMVDTKIRTIGMELEQVETLLKSVESSKGNGELKLLQQRVKLVRKYESLANKILRSPILNDK